MPKKNAAAGVLSFELLPLAVKRQSLPLEVEVGCTVRAHALRRLKGDSLNTFAKINLLLFIYLFLLQFNHITCLWLRCNCLWISLSNVSDCV